MQPTVYAGPPPPPPGNRSSGARDPDGTAPLGRADPNFLPAEFWDSVFALIRLSPSVIIPNRSKRRPLQAMALYCTTRVSAPLRPFGFRSPSQADGSEALLMRHLFRKDPRPCQWNKQNPTTSHRGCSRHPEQRRPPKPS